MGIWYAAPIDSQKELVLFENIPLPYQSSSYITFNKTQGKLGLLSLPNTTAFLYPNINAKNINLAVDGRIYNSKALCRILHLDDGEDIGKIITLLYKKYGPEGIYRLDGAFSLILVDIQKNITLLYRSFLTGFPLYYTAKNNLLSVSTNPIDILRRNDVDDSLNMEQMSGFFSLNIHAWTESIFASVDEVAYGEIVIISSKGVQSKKRALNKLFIPQSYGCESEIIEKYYQIAKGTVEKYIVPNKKYGIMLSSGVDSGTIAALASKHLKEKGSELHAYSWSLPNYITGDETEKIKELCNALNIKLTLFNGERFAPFRRLDQGQLLPDIPFNNLYWPMLSELYKLASEDGIDILFNGHFGDSIFPAKQTIFKDLLRDRRLELLLSEWDTMVKEIGYLNTIKRLPAVHALIRYLLPFRNRNRNLTPEWLSSEAKKSRITVLNNSRRDDEKMNKLYSNALSKMVINSGVGRYITGQFGIERVEPYMDLTLLNYTLNLPAYMAYRKGQKKYIAREAMRGILPDSIRTQVKYNVGNLSQFAYESFIKNKSEMRERIFDERDPWKVYVDEKWMERKFKKNAEIKDQDIIVIWMSLHIISWQKAIKPGGSLYKGTFMQNWVNK